MKKALLTALVLTAAVAFGALGDVVASYASPNVYPIALARATNVQSMWVYTNAGPGYIYRLNADSGSVYATYATSNATNTHGLTYQYGGYIYLGNMSTDYIYRYNDAFGTLYSSYAAHHDMYGGLAVKATADGGNGATQIWSTDTSPSMAYLHNITTGSVVMSFAGNSSGICDPAWDWRNNLLWAGTASAAARVYGYNTAGSVVASFTVPANYAWGATYYNQYLWISTTIGSDRIWKVHCPSGLTGIAPSSLGRVKAIYK
jgi:hypothetical protein